MTIHWAFGLISKILSSYHTDELNQVLGDRELEYLSGLRFEKRRNEWLAGRLALKRLLWEVHPEYGKIKGTELQILRAESGSPYIYLDGKTRPGIVSISHSNGWVCCAYSGDQTKMGIDLELIEERSSVFQQDYFTTEELLQIDVLPDKDKAFSSTLIWSGKEAVLKALSLGLKIDTRKIGIGIHPGVSFNGWSEIDVLYKENLRIYWRREDQFIMTVCVGENISADFRRFPL